MKAADVSLGKVYVVKVSGRLQAVRLDQRSSYDARRYYGTNLSTGRRVGPLSPARLRWELRSCKVCGAKETETRLYRVERLSLDPVCEPCGKAAIAASPKPQSSKVEQE